MSLSTEMNISENIGAEQPGQESGIRNLEIIPPVNKCVPFTVTHG